MKRSYSSARVCFVRFTIATLLAAIIPSVATAAQWDLIGPTGGTVRALATLPGQPDELLAALWKFGVYRSTDGGHTWVPSSTGLTYTDMARLAVAPSDPRIVYATTLRGDLFVSRDRGHTWSDPTEGWSLETGVAVEIAVDPTDPDVVYAGGRDANLEFRLLRSDDGGRNWGDIEGPFASRISAVVLDPDDPRTIFVAMERDPYVPGGLLRSTDGGTTWQPVIEGRGVWSAAIDPSNSRRVLAGADYGVMVSTNNGASFTQIDSSPGAVRTFVFDPERSGTVWAGNPGGVARSDDRGQSWTPVENGEPVRPASAIAVADGDVLTGGEVLAGGSRPLSLLIGLFRSEGGVGPWKRSNRGFQVGPPTFGMVELATDPPTLLVSSTWLYRSTDRGRTMEVVDLERYGGWFAAAPSNPGTVYMAGGDDQVGGFVFRSDDAGVTWRQLAVPVSYGAWGPVVDPRNADVVYVLLKNTQYRNVLVKTTDGGVSWVQILGHRDAKWNTVALDPHDPDVVLVGGWADGMVRSTDGGASWRMVDQFEGGYGEGFYTIAFDPHLPGAVVAGGALGSWFSQDGGVTWNDSPYPYIVPFRTAAHVFDAQVPGTVYALNAFDLVPIQTTRRLDTYAPLVDGLPTVPSDCIGACPERIPVPIWDLAPGADGNSLYGASEFGLYRLRLAALDAVFPNIGGASGGTEVTLVGDGFGPGTWAFFGDQPAAKTVVISESVLVATTSPHPAGAVDVAVRTRQGRTVSARSAFTFSEQAEPGISLDPGMQVVQAGDSASLTVTLATVQVADVEVALDATSATALDLPPTVAIPAGQRSATVTARAVAYEGSGVWVTAALPVALGGASASAQVIVDDELHEPPAELVVPGVASAEGANGSFFRTSLWITNPGPLDTALRLRYVPAVGQQAGGGRPSMEVRVPALESVVFEDLLSEAFGARETFGTLIVDVYDGLPVPLVSARTYNDAGDAGTFGQYIEAVPIPEPTVRPSWWTQVLVGLGGNSQVRTNVGVQNLGTEELQVTLQVFGADGGDLGTPVEVTVPPLALVQVNKINVAAGAGARKLFGVRVQAYGGRFFAYASKVDQKTSDPIFIPGDLAPQLANPLWLDGIAATQGAGGTFFRSNLVIANLSEAPVEVTARFAPWGQSMDESGEPSHLATLGPLETVQFDDVLTEVFGLSEVAGTLELVSNGGIIAWARTYNDAGEEGTYGQLICPVIRADFLADGGAILHGLSQNDRFRTNMGLWAASATTLEATLYTSGGEAIASKSYQLESNTQLFVSKVARDLGEPWISGGFLRLVPRDRYSVYAWTSVVDNRSSDQTFIRPLRVGQ